MCAKRLRKLEIYTATRDKSPIQDFNILWCLVSTAHLARLWSVTCINVHDPSKRHLIKSNVANAGLYWYTVNHLFCIHKITVSGCQKAIHPPPLPQPSTAVTEEVAIDSHYKRIVTAIGSDGLQFQHPSIQMRFVLKTYFKIRSTWTCDAARHRSVE